VLTIPILLAGALFFWLGWKARGIFDHRPRWLKWGKKKEPVTAFNGKPVEKKGGIFDQLSRTGEKIVGKGVELFAGRPKGPKDDDEEEP
jgi:hypothetical protein